VSINEIEIWLLNKNPDKIMLIEPLKELIFCDKIKKKKRLPII
jgi:hypothetical protein